MRKTEAISTRLEPSIRRDLNYFLKSEKLDRSTGIRKLLSIGLDEWKRERAIDLLRQGKVTISKAAGIADISLWEMVDLIKTSGIKSVDLTPEDLEKDIEAAKKLKKK